MGFKSLLLKALKDVKNLNPPKRKRANNTYIIDS